LIQSPELCALIAGMIADAWVGVSHGSGTTPSADPAKLGLMQMRRILLLAHGQSPTVGNLTVTVAVAVADLSIASSPWIVTPGMRMRNRRHRDVLRLEGVAIETPAVENLSRLVQGDHLEELLTVAFSTTSHTLSSFRSGDGQFGFRHDRSGAVEIRSEIIHPSRLHLRSTMTFVLAVVVGDAEINCALILACPR